MRSVCIIQARTTSKRLPNKVLADICGSKMLSHVLNRVKQSRVDDIVLAIPDTIENDILEGFGGVDFYRGSELDVLDRYYQAALKFKAEIIIRVTSDCPLVDPTLIDKLLALTGSVDYANCVGYPLGIGSEMFSIEALGCAVICANKPYQREHVSPYLKEGGEWLLRGQIVNPDPRSYRLCVDEPDDLEMIRRVVSKLGPNCTTQEIVTLLDTEPQLICNAHVKQKAMTQCG